MGITPPTDEDFDVGAFQLRLLRVNEQDNPDGGGLVVPVWFVCGAKKNHTEATAGSLISMDNNFDFEAASEIMMRINAINGTMY